MTQYLLKRTSDLTKENSLFRIEGIIGTAAANATTNIDWQFPQERWITGGSCIVKGGHWGDTLTLQIIDKDNLLGGGAGLVLGTHVNNFVIQEDRQFQVLVECPYVALVPAGMYIRLIYTNGHASETCGVALNLYSHIPRDI